MLLNAVELDILQVVYNQMVYYKRTWSSMSRQLIQEQLKGWYKRDISLSWIDDCLGKLYKHRFLRFWQRGLHGDDGTWAGSESRKQLGWIAVQYLTARRIKVIQKVKNVARRAWKPKEPPTATRYQPEDPHPKFLKPKGKSRFEDPEFRKRKGWKPLPPFKKKTK